MGIPRPKTIQIQKSVKPWPASMERLRIPMSWSKDTHTHIGRSSHPKLMVPTRPPDFTPKGRGSQGPTIPLPKVPTSLFMTTEGIGLVAGSSYSAPRCCGHWGRGKHAKHKAPFLAAAYLLHSRLRAGCAVLHTARRCCKQSKQAPVRGQGCKAEPATDDYGWIPYPRLLFPFPESRACLKTSLLLVAVVQLHH